MPQAVQQAGHAGRSSTAWAARVAGQQRGGLTKSAFRADPTDGPERQPSPWGRGATSGLDTVTAQVIGAVRIVAFESLG